MPVGEKKLIQQIRRLAGRSRSGGRAVATGIGDDCAVLRAPRGHELLVTTDFSAANQGAPGELGSHGLRFPATGPVIRDAVIDWIRKKKLIE